MPYGLSILLAGIVGVTALAQTPVRTEDQKLVPSDVEQGYGLGFGASLAAAGDWLVVGAPSDLEGGFWFPGAVYVYRREGDRWVQHAKLLSPPEQSEPNLGSAVATDGNVLVTAGTDLDFDVGPGPGAIYVYRRDDAGTPQDPADDEWLFESRIPGEWLTPFRGERLGVSVAIHGDVIVGGTSVQWLGSQDPGRARVFRFDGRRWILDGVLMGGESGGGDSFGYPVALDGRTIVVGATTDDEFTGAAYVFKDKRDGWIQAAKLRPAAQQTARILGRSVAVTGRDIVLGGRTSDASQMRSGIAVYEAHGRDWEQTHLLSPSDGPVDDFGRSVAIQSRRILVGARSRSVYVFAHHGREWLEQEKLVASDPAPGANFGSSVGLAEEDALVGDPSLGAVYSYSMGQDRGRYYRER
jgi:hypothetical protein